MWPLRRSRERRSWSRFRSPGIGLELRLQGTLVSSPPRSPQYDRDERSRGNEEGVMVEGNPIEVLPMRAQAWGCWPPKSSADLLTSVGNQPEIFLYQLPCWRRQDLLRHGSAGQAPQSGNRLAFRPMGPAPTAGGASSPRGSAHSDRYPRDCGPMRHSAAQLGSQLKYDYVELAVDRSIFRAAGSLFDPEPDRYGTNSGLWWDGSRSRGRGLGPPFVR